MVASLRRGGSLWIVLAVLAAVGGALTAAYFLRLLRRVTHGSASDAVTAIGRPSLAGAEIVAWSPLVVLALVVGLVPALVLAMAHGPVAVLAAAVVR